MLVAGLVIGVLVVLLVIVLIARRRHADEAVFGSVPDSVSDGRPAAPSSQSTESPAVNDVPEALRQAGADGHIGDDEIQRLLPGAQVTRDGDQIRIEQKVTSIERIDSITDANGNRYDSIDDIPDPAVRDELRKLLDP